MLAPEISRAEDHLGGFSPFLILLKVGKYGLHWVHYAPSLHPPLGSINLMRPQPDGWRRRADQPMSCRAILGRELAWERMATEACVSIWGRTNSVTPAASSTRITATR